MNAWPTHTEIEEVADEKQWILVCMASSSVHISVQYMEYSIPTAVHLQHFLPGALFLPIGIETKWGKGHVTLQNYISNIYNSEIWLCPQMKHYYLHYCSQYNHCFSVVRMGGLSVWGSARQQPYNSLVDWLDTFEMNWATPSTAFSWGHWRNYTL